MTTARFYDDIAHYYDLIFQDWESSMSRQGAAIDQLIGRELGSEHQPSEISSLDASAGIGTQALPLARKGFRVTARDISPDAIARLQRETAERGLVIPSAVADMRALLAQHLRTVIGDGSFDFIQDQHGMFSLLGVSPQAVERLRDQHHIFMMHDSRINLAGIMPHNVEYVARAVAEEQ